VNSGLVNCRVASFALTLYVRLSDEPDHDSTGINYGSSVGIKRQIGLYAIAVQKTLKIVQRRALSASALLGKNKAMKSGKNSRIMALNR
jgi:hypothetical protein